MGTELTRRELIAWLGSGVLTWPAAAAAGSMPRLAASWQVSDGRYQVGWLRPDPAQHRWHVQAAVDVPTRAHGIAIGPRGELYAAARRPGDWLLRWAPADQPRWAWMPSERTLNGHILLHPNGRWLLSTETDMDTGMGWVSVRATETLQTLQTWPTHGRDPHQLIWDHHRPDHFFVANGGIETRPETGRRKHSLDTMDSSLVCLDLGHGELKGQWRLDDARLSVRHLAWAGDRLGVALQAEHDDDGQRRDAPVLAVLEPAGLRTVRFERPLAGYGGDIIGTSEGFAVGCPRAGGVALYHRDGRPRGWIPWPQACALARDRRDQLWVAGHPLAGTITNTWQTLPLQLDNHWQME